MARIFAYIVHKNGVADDSAAELPVAARKIDPASSCTAIVSGWNTRNVPMRPMTPGTSRFERTSIVPSGRNSSVMPSSDTMRPCRSPKRVADTLRAPFGV